MGAGRAQGAHPNEGDRVGITPKSWTAERHHGVLHLGKRWYVVSAELDEHGRAEGVRLDGPYEDRAEAESRAGALMQDRPA